MNPRGRDPRFLVLPLLLISLAIAPPVRAASLIAPENLGELALASDAVVLARAGASRVDSRGQLFFTTTEFDVLRALAGPHLAGDTIAVQTPGGELDGEAWIVPGDRTFRTATSTSSF